jgi:hypothetical protein
MRPAGQRCRGAQRGRVIDFFFFMRPAAQRCRGAGEPSVAGLPQGLILLKKHKKS